MQTPPVEFIGYHGSDKFISPVDLMKSRTGSFGPGGYLGDKRCADVYGNEGAGALNAYRVTTAHPLIVPACFDLGERYDVDTAAGYLVHALYGPEAPVAALIDDDCMLSSVVEAAVKQAGYSGVIAVYNSNAFEAVIYNPADLQMSDPSKKDPGLHPDIIESAESLRQNIDASLAHIDPFTSGQFGLAVTVEEDAEKKQATLALRTFNHKRNEPGLNKKLVVASADVQSAIQDIADTGVYDSIHVFDEQGYTGITQGQITARHQVSETLYGAVEDEVAGDLRRELVDHSPHSVAR